MSGSSLDGLDIAYVELTEVRGQWSFSLLESACIAYPNEWASQLKNANTISVPAFLRLHAAYGEYLGKQVRTFMERHQLEHKVSFIASHGHTVYHDPAHKTTFQLGEGAALAATAGLPVINDLRAMDVAFGGQGAPIVPIGDKLLFGTYHYLLNIGGIANMTTWHDGHAIAFDICPANQVLNQLARNLGFDMDESGKLAQTGILIPDILQNLQHLPYYQQIAPKSLSNEHAMEMVFPILMESSQRAIDLLHTYTLHIAEQVCHAVQQYPSTTRTAQMLITGGGAFNTYLVERITQQLAPLGITVVVPDDGVIKFKEAIIMALIGTLRWREEANVYSTVTGATLNSVGGALWIV